MNDDLHSGVQSAHSRARILIYLLAASLILNVIGVFSSMGQHSLLASARDGTPVTTEQAEANDSRQQAVGLLQVAVFIAAAILWLFWQHRAYSNLRLVGSRDTEMTPGWSVGYWFIPFINLVRPYQVTAELWRKSELQNARDPIGGLSRPGIIGVWWVVYLVQGFAGRAFATTVKSATTLDQLVTATDVGIVADVIGVASCILAIVVVRGIDRFQADFPAAVATPVS